MLNRVLTVFENTIVTIAFSVVSIIAFANVLSRYVFNLSLSFSTEITVNMAVLLTMVGAAIGVRENAHLGFTLLHEKAGPTLKKVLTVLVAAALAVFFLILLKFSVQLALQQLKDGRATPSLGIPQWMFTAALPLGATLGIARTISSAVVSLQGSNREPNPMNLAV